MLKFAPPRAGLWGLALTGLALPVFVILVPAAAALVAVSLHLPRL